MQEDNTREVFADAAEIAAEASTTPVPALQTPLEIRSLDGAVEPVLYAWIRERFGRHLGKFASQLERIEVRFSDENGPRGGVDRHCLVHLMLSALPAVVVEDRGKTDREAFDLAAGRCERALKHTLSKHSFSVRHKAHQRSEHDGAQVSQATEISEDAIDTQDSLYGRREGRGAAALALLTAHEGGRRALEPSDGAIGEHHTAIRNTKLNTAGMTHDLEDSTSGRPSRKSTRRSHNHSKSATPMTTQAKNAVHTPSAQAARAARKHG